MLRILSLSALITLLTTTAAPAQTAREGSGPSAPAAFELPEGYAGPPVPVAPATVSRDAAGRLTIRAVRLTSPLRVDGALDEALYRDVQPASDFVQIEPDDGQPARNQTQVWLSFDDDNVYVSVNALEHDMTSLIATELRRDGASLFMGNDVVAFMFDTFYDRRNAVLFDFNPAGGRGDGQVSNERVYSGDWNPVWDVQTKRNADGWTAEAAVPFKSIRYQPGRQQVWGFQVERIKRSTNEVSFLAHPPKARLLQAYQHVGVYATVVGIEAPQRFTNIDVKPYLTSSLVTDVNAQPRLSNDPAGDFGIDARVGLGQNLAADLTYNTDFAQVEVDDQQVNLTRFSLFFPEKREFFLENQGIFSFGGVSGREGGSEAPLMFYSRRIGLNQSRVVPIDGGGRLTGRLGRFTVGALSMRSGEDEVSGAQPTTFSVVRLKRDILGKSSIGAIYTGRSVAQNGVGSNQLYGVDAMLAFYQNLNINAYWARTESTGRPGKDGSYRVQLDYTGDRYGTQLERLEIGTDFNPEVGFVRRPDLQKNRAQFRFSPRPRSSQRIRKYAYQATYDAIENGEGVLEQREWEGEFWIDFQDGGRLRFDYLDTYEFLPRSFRIAPDVTLPVGEYNYTTYHLGYMMSQQHRFSLAANMDHGTFYNGRKTTVSVNRARTNFTSQLSLEPTYSFNRVTLAQGNFTTHLVGSRVTFAATPLMFASALVQYNSSSHLVSANVRFRWEYQPGSELFVVFNEERDTLGMKFPGLANRAFIVKINRLFRF